jgi:hypothetical protein
MVAIIDKDKYILVGISLALLVVVTMLLLVRVSSMGHRPYRNYSRVSTSQVSICSLKECGKETGLLPVHEPSFNMREMIKQLILLEDHLFQKEKLCVECINKHFMAIEAFAEEGITLDKNGQYVEPMNTVAMAMREHQALFNTKKMEPRAIAMKLRQTRKGLMKKVQLHI